MDKKLVKKYADENLTRCPYCESYDVYSLPVEYEDLKVVIEVTCRGCGKTWGEVFEFVGVMQNNQITYLKETEDV